MENIVIQALIAIMHHLPDFIANEVIRYIIYVVAEKLKRP